MAKRFTLKMGDCLKSADAKRNYNRHVFAEIAPRYDFITRALSFGRDAAWKRDLVGALPPLPAPLCLDLACGTGDIAFLLAKKYPKGDIVGLDITEPMLAAARMRHPLPHLRFANQDMGRLDFADQSADLVTGGYALRNAPDLPSVIGEIRRVLKPGGIAAFLDFSKPPAPAGQKLHYWILKLWGGLWGLLLHRNHEVYSYIAESLASYPDRDRLHEMLKNSGFSILTTQLYFLGITELLVIRREAP
jgi:ubiquinone/menaquinone biosynthesis methyltransferase